MITELITAGFVPFKTQESKYVGKTELEIGIVKRVCKRKRSAKLICYSRKMLSLIWITLNEQLFFFIVYPLLRY